MKIQKSNFRLIAFLLFLSVIITAFGACSNTDSESSTVISQSESSFGSESSSVLSEPSKSDISDAESSVEDSSVVDESYTESSDIDSSNEESDAPSEPEISKKDAFRLSSVDDLTDKDGTRTYIVYAPYSDIYNITGTNVSGIEISENGATLKKGQTNISVSLVKDKVYTLKITTAKGEQDFKITTEAKNHLVTLPYDVATPENTSKYNVNGNDELKPAEVDYVKRDGGTYIYSNNPEMFGAQHVGKAFMRNKGLSGEVYVTFEHANYSGKDAYLGYQLKNESDHDVYVTVTNVGYQWIGTWFGQLAWYDFYNTSFELPDDYFTASGAISSKYSGLDYAYRKYTPRVYQPTTYRLPAGEYFWVIGGTSADAYRNINVDNSANHFVNPVRCANGNVKFTVSGGEVTGTMYCYTNASQVSAEPTALGYVAAGYAQQYSGIADHHGVIDNFMSWTFNDEVGSGMLPVTYTNYYANNLPAKTSPYAAYNSTAHTTAKATTWMTHLNPQNDHRAVGMDLVEFKWHDGRGKEIVIDNNHADGAGLPANTANWMIEYQDHFTFVNQGDTARKVTLHLRDHGSLALLVRDSKTGDVLDTAFTAGLGAGNVFSNYTYEISIPAHSVKQITLDYLLVACSYGSVTHAVSIE